VAGDKLQRIDPDGGAPIALCEATVNGLAWSEDGQILFADQRIGLQRIPASGGAPSPVMKLNQDAGEYSYSFPQVLPGGGKFLYFVLRNEEDKTGIYIGSFDGRPSSLFLKTRFRAAYDAASGFLFYIQGEGLGQARRHADDSQCRVASSGGCAGGPGGGVVPAPTGDTNVPGCARRAEVSGDGAGSRRRAGIADGGGAELGGAASEVAAHDI
jgi:hypothetical protein